MYSIEFESAVLQKSDPPGSVAIIPDRSVAEFAPVRLFQQLLPAIIIPLQTALGNTVIDTPLPEFRRDAQRPVSLAAARMHIGFRETFIRLQAFALEPVDKAFDPGFIQSVPAEFVPEL